MADLAKIHTDRLQELKDTIEEAQEYFKDNADRFQKFIRFAFKTSMNDDEVSTLASMGKPTIEFNIVEATISRQRGEFAKQQPSLTVRAADGIPADMLTPNMSELLDVLEAHFRCIFFDASNDMLDYNVFTHLLAGGYDVMRVYTEYVNEKSFEQNIKVALVFDPTLTVFDPLARDSHKGDGRYCGEIYPMTRSSFEAKYGKEATESMKFTRSLSGFDWTFQNGEEEIILVCDYYEKRAKKEKIIKLTNGQVMTKKEYEKFLIEWQEKGSIEHPPVPTGQERITNLEHIVRYVFCESKVLSFEETDFKYLPLVFADGNSVNIKEGAVYSQMTRPYIYHAEGIQRLKNFSGQCLANELENLVQHKFIIPLESIPSDSVYLEAYQNIQKADTLVYKHFLDTNNPQVTLPPPREVVRTPIPPEITNTFVTSDSMLGNVLGNRDIGESINSAQLSGVAFARSALQSNNASIPYLVGYIKALNRVAQIIIDLIPKYYRTPRSLPILLPNGKRSYQEINKPGSLYMNFDPNHLQVKVETGVNYAIQKEIALQTIIAMSQANQGFAQFFNEEGLPTLLDNIDIRGIDQLKEKAEEWMKKQQALKQQAQAMQQQQMQVQQQQQAMQLAQLKKEVMSPSESQIGVMAIQQKAQIDNANLAIKAQDSETKRLEALSKIQNSGIENELKAAEIQAHNERAEVDLAISMGNHISENFHKHYERKDRLNEKDEERRQGSENG